MMPDRLNRLTDNHLHRFLHSKVGQSWDTIYSKLRDRLNFDKLNSIPSYVAMDVQMINGEPYHNYFAGIYYHDLYVHPDTGLLCQVARSPKNPNPKNDDLVKIDDYHHYQKLEGVWYHITLKDLPTGEYAYDVVHKRNVLGEGYRNPTYAVSKRQCGKKELKLVASMFVFMKSA